MHARPVAEGKHSQCDPQVNIRLSGESDPQVSLSGLLEIAVQLESWRGWMTSVWLAAECWSFPDAS
jgi:hypothetical protein